MKNQELLRVLAIGIVGILLTGFTSAATQVSTECIGNRGNCGPTNGGFHDQDGISPVEWLGVRWDGDKVRGLSFSLFSGQTFIVGDFSKQYGYSEIRFSPGETLTSLRFKDSGYGHNSLRRLELSTGRQVFGAGPGGFDNVVAASGVAGTRLSGFYGLVNPDNFMQSLGAYILLPDAAPATGLKLNTEFIGNNFERWSGGFVDQDGNSPVQWLGVRWDGDKVRGLCFRLFNGHKFTEGDFSQQYSYSEIYFSPGENLASLTLKDSGYGHGSLRRIEMTTSKGQKFSAGPDGFDSVRTPAVAGATLVGFFGLVNVDNFMQSLGAIVVYPDCSGIVIDQDESSSTTPVTDLTGLAGPEELCSTTQITCDYTPTPSGNRRLLLGTTSASHRRSLKDDVTLITNTNSSEYSYFTDTVALYNLDISIRAANPSITLFTNGNTPDDLSWRIDRQASTFIAGIRYNLLAVQGGPDRQRGQTFASVLVPTAYNIGSRRIRNAFIVSQRNARTVVLQPSGGYAADWNFVHNSMTAPPQGTQPPGQADDRSNNYTRSILWTFVLRSLIGFQGCR